MAAKYPSRHTVLGVLFGLCVTLTVITMLLEASDEISFKTPAISVATLKLKQSPSNGSVIEKKNTTGPLPMSVTSHTKTNVQLISPRGHIQVGDIIKYRIQTRDSEGRDRVIGGDFWFATLNSKNPLASTAGYVADYNNGTYEVTLLAAWAGQAEFKLILVHPSEAVDYFKNVVWPAKERVQWNGYFNHKGKKAERTTCFLRSGGPWTGLCQYPAHHALGKTILVCRKPNGLSCDDFTSYNTDWNKCNQRLAELTKGVEYIFKGPNFMQPVRIEKNKKIQIDAGFLPPLNDLPRCLPDQEIPAVQGYWLRGKWHSMLCRIPDFPKDMLHKCLRDKKVILHGDSTIGQWYKDFNSVLKADNPKASSNVRGHLKPVQTIYRSLNLTVAYYFHPERVGSDIYGRKDMKYEVDVLDKLTTLDCQTYIIVLSPWSHFTVWTSESFIERTALIRNAVLRLRKRCPNILIVIKGPHPRHFPHISSPLLFSDFLAKEIIGNTLRDGFKGTGAFYLPLWDMNLAHPAMNSVHMPHAVIVQELKMFLGYVCDNLATV